MGSVIEAFPTTTAMEAANPVFVAPVPVPDSVPTEFVAPDAGQTPIHPALAARIAARHRPRQDTWREDRPVKGGLLSPVQLYHIYCYMLRSKKCIDRCCWCWYRRYINSGPAVEKGA